MRKPPFEDFVGAWQRARELYGEDVAQEGALRALDRRNKKVNPIASLMTKCRWLSRIGYTDGADIKRLRQKYTHGSPIEDWLPVPIFETPEGVAIAREEASRLDKIGGALLVGARNQGMDLNVCRNGHEGSLRYYKDKNGWVYRRCLICANSNLKRFREREQGGQASEGL